MFDNSRNDILVRLKNVGVTLGGKTVLEDISFDIPAGRILTLIGPNGAGKTTLLKVILGVLNPDKGAVERKAGLKTGYVPQKTNLSRAMPVTVRRFLCLDKRYNDDELAAALNLTGLPPDFLDKSVHPLSGGETQRVMLARTLLKHPDLLILDEPAQGLDPVGEERFYALLDSLNQTEKCAIVMVSHDLHIVMAGSHRVLCVNRHICCSGAPDEIVSLPEYGRLYGDRPALAVYRHHHDHRHLPDGSVEYVD